MKQLFLGLVATALLVSPNPARACIAMDFMHVMMHDALPRPLPRGTIVADVAFESTDDAQLRGAGIRARIRRMIQGDYRGDTLIIRQRIRTSCDAPFHNGAAGLIVATPIDMQDGVLVVSPITVNRAHQYRLPDGYQIPEPPPGAIPLQQ
jgi:hypothetical protein